MSDKAYENKTAYNGSLPEVSQSYWISTSMAACYQPLEGEVKVDAAIIGGGLAGISTAYFLKKAGLSVAVAEADRIGLGTTGHTTAKITSQHELIYSKLIKQVGYEKARQYADANETAIDEVARLVSEKSIDCDFERQPAYVYTLSDKYIQRIEDESKAASDLGIKASFHASAPLPFKTRAALKFENQAQFHPRSYLLALANEIPGGGSHIFERTRIVDIRDGEPCVVISETGARIIARDVVQAAHYPFYDGGGLYFTRIYPERSYIIGMLSRDKLAEGMFINAEEPARSLRSQNLHPWNVFPESIMPGETALPGTSSSPDEICREFGRMILVGGDHHKTGQGENMMEHYRNLESFAKEHFNVHAIPFRWSAQDCMTLDDIPYIGRQTPHTRHIYVATGFRKWGMTTSTVSAMVISDLIVKGDSRWASVFDPSRFKPVASVKNFVVENANVAAQLVGGKLKGVPDIGEADLQSGEARLIDMDGRKTGAYMDEEGRIHTVGSTCTHLGCEVKWNDAEKSWDCPCHGSRYTIDGNVMEGPTIKPLAGSRILKASRAGRK